MVTVVVVRRWNMAITVSVDTLLQHGMFFFVVLGKLWQQMIVAPKMSFWGGQVFCTQEY